MTEVAPSSGSKADTVGPMAEDALTGEKRILRGRYQLERLIARGNSAEVWRGRDRVLARPIAVKLLRPDLAANGDLAERFRREAVAAARLVHPNVLSIYDTGDDNGAFIVMELAPATSLRDVLVERGTLSPRQAVQVTAKVAEALDYAHQAGVIHCGLKPANILLGEDERVLVADFGVARAISVGDLANTENTIAATSYLAPEQVQGDKVDARTDIYALGVVLYEALCGRPPFSADTASATALLRLSADAPRPRQIRAGIPRPLEDVVMRAMSRDPASRYFSAADFRTALLAVDLGREEPAPLPPPREVTPPSSALSFRQTERSWLVPAGLILLVALILGVVGTLFARTEVGRDLIDSARGQGQAAPSGEPARLASANLFDPGGDGNEHNRELGNLVDNNGATTWETHQYYTGRPFGGLKDGVGLVFAVEGGRKRLGVLEVLSPTRGWDAQVYVADRAANTLTAWGKPVAAQSNIDGNARFDLGGAEGAFVLVWLTNPGPAQKTVIAEAALRT